MSLLVGVAVLLVVLVVIDRILLRLESRGWINYRRHGLSRGGAVYHTLELHSIFDPAVRPVLEVRYAQEREDEDSGAPPGADRGDPGESDPGESDPEEGDPGEGDPEEGDP